MGIKESPLNLDLKASEADNVGVGMTCWYSLDWGSVLCSCSFWWEEEGWAKVHVKAGTTYEVLSLFP